MKAARMHEYGKPAVLEKATGQRQLDAILDCTGAPELIQLGFSLLALSGHYANVAWSAIAWTSRSCHASTVNRPSTARTGATMWI